MADTQTNITIVQTMQDLTVCSNEDWEHVEPLASKLILAGAMITRSRGLCPSCMLRAVADYLEENDTEEQVH